MAYDLAKVTKAVLALRDERSRIRREYEAADAKLQEDVDKLEAVLLKTLLDNSAKNMATSNATFYREEVVKPSCTDWPAFYKFIAENDCFEALERRVTKTFVQAYVDEHKTLPPGIAVHRETVVRVRRSKD